MPHNIGQEAVAPIPDIGAWDAMRVGVPTEFGFPSDTGVPSDLRSAVGEQPRKPAQAAPRRQAPQPFGLSRSRAG